MIRKLGFEILNVQCRIIPTSFAQKTGVTMLKSFVTGLVILAATLSFAPQANAQQQPNLLIMGEDADLDTVARNSRIFNRVLRALEAELQAEGFRVYDETAVSMGVTDPQRVRRTDAELITVARRIQDAPIDAIIVFQIYASTEQNPYAAIMDLRVRIPGRMLNAQTGQALANYEITYGPNDLPPLPPNCSRDCVLEHVGDQARRIAADVGAVLARQLDYLSPAAPAAATALNSDARPEGCVGLTTAYTLTFRGFDSDEITLIEDYLAAFSGYHHHRPMRAGATESTYWYETCTDTARLNRNLRLMAEHMGVEVRLGMVQNRFEIDKIRPPRSR
jgi:hypothetical protein